MMQDQGCPQNSTSLSTPFISLHMTQLKKLDAECALALGDLPKQLVGLSFP